MSVGKKSKSQTDKVRRHVFDRDGNRCVAAGAFGFCGGDLTLQHRAVRGMGGSALLDGFDNLLTMCQIHNELDQASHDFHRLCLKLGWSMPRWVAEQGFADVLPVWFSDRGWFQLDTDGALTWIDQKTAKTVFAAIYGVGWISDPEAGE